MNLYSFVWLSWTKVIEGGESESEVSLLLLLINNQLIINIINFSMKLDQRVIEGGESESQVSSLLLINNQLIINNINFSYMN
jgi:hypothetical protein